MISRSMISASKAVKKLQIHVYMCKVALLKSFWIHIVYKLYLTHIDLIVFFIVHGKTFCIFFKSSHKPIMQMTSNMKYNSGISFVLYI